MSNDEQDVMQRTFHELMRPRYIVAAFVLGMILGWIFVVKPPPAAGDFRPAAVDHEDQYCWDFQVRPNGRTVVVVKDAERAYRGAPCRGPVILRVRLPNGTHEDEVFVERFGGRVHVMLTYP